MGESCQENAGIDGTAGPFEDTSNRNHPEYAILTYEAVFDKSPFVVPSNQACTNLKGLEYLEILSKFGDGIAYHGERLLLPRKAEQPCAHEPMYPT